MACSLAKTRSTDKDRGAWSDSFTGSFSAEEAQAYLWRAPASRAAHHWPRALSGPRNWPARACLEAAAGRSQLWHGHCGLAGILWAQQQGHMNSESCTAPAALHADPWSPCQALTNCMAHNWSPHMHVDQNLHVRLCQNMDMGMHTQDAHAGERP